MTTAANLANVGSSTDADSSGNFKFNSGYGSVATAYGCRAWVNFNGTGTVAIRASGNVSSITDNGTGDYNVNFATAMPNTNYCVVVGANTTVGVGGLFDLAQVLTRNTTSYNVITTGDPNVATKGDMESVYGVIFR